MPTWPEHTLLSGHGPAFSSVSSDFYESAEPPGSPGNCPIRSPLVPCSSGPHRGGGAAIVTRGHGLGPKHQVKYNGDYHQAVLGRN